MNNWEEKKKEYIDILTESNTAIEKILGIKNKSQILSSDEIKKIKEYEKDNSAYLEKLKKDIFELAIVGLEKAGKSTFSNALISNNVLPTKPGRCTFTSTQLRYGNDKAIVEFYTRNEFNEIFRKMLRSIEYSNAKKTNFDTLMLNQFEEYFEGLANTDPSLYNFHRGKTEEDIKDIIKGKDQISNYLGKDNLIYKDGELKSEEFQSFITDNIKSRVVKRIIIESSQLEDMENMIIYDVPGFDSPTQIHEEQTLEKLKDADAIILMTNIGDKPNLNAPQLNLLTKKSDYDGIKLNEKLFIFGNKIDMANNKEDALSNIETLKDDALNKHRVLKSDNRLLAGSAYAYLEDKGILPAQGIANKLNSFDLNDNIEIIKEKLKEYYKTERFEILKKRINKNIEDLKVFCTKIINDNKEEYDIEKLNFVERKTENVFTKRANEKLKELLNNLEDKLKKDISDEKYFTKKLKKLIEDNFDLIDEDIIEKARKEVSKARSREFPVEKVNGKIRDDLFGEFLEKFTDMTISLADEKAESINQEIIDCFMEALKMDNSDQYYQEIREKAIDLVENITSDVSYNKRSFVQLIERFSRDLFDILINYRFAAEGRLNKFKETKEDFYSLAMYHSKKNPNKPYYMQPLIEIVLAHGDDIENKLFNKIQSVTAVKDLFNPSDKVVKSCVSKLSKKDINVNVIINKLGDDLEKINPKERDRDRKNMAGRILKNSIDKYINNFQKRDIDQISEEEYINSLTANIETAKNKKELLAEINLDIKYLKDLLKDAVLKGISLESPFISTINKKINKLINSIYDAESEEFEEFYAANIDKILYNELAEIQNKKALYQNREKILNQINKIIEGMDL